MSSNSVDIIEASAGGIRDLLKRKAAKAFGDSLERQYSPELRAFALTLHFYSPRAYNFVRDKFDTCLPHPRTIEKWYQTIDGKPGFTSEAFKALQLKVDSAKAKGKSMPCALIMDEMAIRQHVEWDGMRAHGYVDMGAGVDDDALPVAKEALVFMVVSLNDSWRLPVGYFLIDSLGASERKNLVTQCIKQLHDSGIIIIIKRKPACAM